MIYRTEIPRKGRFDLVVCGGGFSGFATAFSAAREGLRVLLAEENFALGGVGTSALVNHILGVRYVKETGVCTCVKGLFSALEEEMIARGEGVDYRLVKKEDNPHGWKPSLSAGLIFDCEGMKRLLEEKLLSVGVNILYGTRLVDVVKTGDAVEGVILHNKSGLFVVEADFFADATGDGDLAFLADAAYEKGDETGGLAAASLEMHVENVDDAALRRYMLETGDLRFTAIIEDLKKRGLWHFPYEIFISVLLTRPGTYMINTIRQVGVDGTDGDSLTRAALEGRQENYRLLSVMREHFPGFQNAVVRRIAPTVGIRETRRILCDYTLSVGDLVEATSFSDSIALSAYSWDLPDPKKPSLQPYRGVKRKSRITEIPYRCLLPRSLSNVIVVGRCIGVEREVLGPVRVMGPCLAMGEAAGVAVAEAKRSGVSLRLVNCEKMRSILRGYGALVSREDAE